MPTPRLALPALMPALTPALRLILIALSCLAAASSHAQTQTPSDATPILVSTSALPDAPAPQFAGPPQASSQSPTPPPNAATPITNAPLVNGRPYFQPTRRENFRAYASDLISVRAFLRAGIRGGIEQARDVPTGWGQDFPGYAQRYGSAYAESAIDNSVRFSLGAALHEDVRYLVCHDCTFGHKLANAALYEVTARHGHDGHRIVSPTPIVASFSGPLIAYSAWYPPGYDPAMAAKHAFLGIGTRVFFNLIRELVENNR